MPKRCRMDDGPYREGFIDYCAAHNLPLDFYSWHTYADFSADPYDAVRIGKEIRSLLDAKGFRSSESILSEWNLSADFTDAEKQHAAGSGQRRVRGLGHDLSAGLLALITRSFTVATPPGWAYSTCNGSSLSLHTRYKATAAMLDTPERLDLAGSDTFGFAAIAGRSRDGTTVQILISNYEIPADFKPHVMAMPPDVQALLKLDFSKLKFLARRTDIHPENNGGYFLTIDHLPWGNAEFTIKRYRITGTEDLRSGGRKLRQRGQG